MIVVGNRPTHDHFSKVSISNFLGDKNMTDMYCRHTCIAVLQKQINVRINHCPHN